VHKDPQSAGLKNEWRYLAAVLLTAALAYGLGVSPHWRISQDSARYLTMAHQVADGRPYEFSGISQRGIPPGLPYYHAIVFKLTGFTRSLENYTEHFTAVSAANVLLGFLGVVSVYFFVRRTAGTRYALIITPLMAVSSAYYDVTVGVWSDPPFCAATWTALWLVARLKQRPRLPEYCLLGAMLAIAASLRVIGVALVAALLVYFAIRLIAGAGGRRWAVTGIMAVMPAAVFSAWLVVTDLSATGTAGFNYSDIVLAGRGASLFFWRLVAWLIDLPGILFQACMGLKSALGLWLPFSAVLIAGVVAALKRGPWLHILYAAIYLFLVGISAGLDPRKSLPVTPILYICLLYGSESALGWLAQWRAGFHARRAEIVKRIVNVAAILVIALNSAHVVKTIASGFAGDFYRNYSHGNWTDYLSLARALRDDPPDGRVMVPAWGVVYVLSGVETIVTPYLRPRELPREPSVAELLDQAAGFRTVPPGLYNEILKRYVEANHVTAVVTDPIRDPRGTTPLEFLANGPLSWRERARYGRLTLYVLDQSAAAPPND